MESNRGVRRRSLSLPPRLDRNDGLPLPAASAVPKPLFEIENLNRGAEPSPQQDPRRQLRAAVHAENGCIEYGPAINAEGIGGFQTKLGPDAFVVIEKWESPGALRVHATSPQIAAYAAKTRDMIANRTVYVLQPG